LINNKGNSFEKTKYGSYSVINDFSKLPSIHIDSPTLFFDSAVTPYQVNFQLTVRQKIYKFLHRKPIFRLTNLDNKKEEIVIIPNILIEINSIEDIGKYFNYPYEIAHKSVLYLNSSGKHNKNLNVDKFSLLLEYSDTELLEELHKRSMDRVGDFRDTDVVSHLDDDISNIINMKDYLNNRNIMDNSFHEELTELIA
jgi:hypothetical protein